MLEIPSKALCIYTSFQCDITSSLKFLFWECFFPLLFGDQEKGGGLLVRQLGTGSDWDKTKDVNLWAVFSDKFATS